MLLFCAKEKKSKLKNNRNEIKKKNTQNQPHFELVSTANIRKIKIHLIVKADLKIKNEFYAGTNIFQSSFVFSKIILSSNNN